MYGTGFQSTAVIILKPQTPGVDTNLLITTDRRAYYLRLISKPEDYVARVAFAQRTTPASGNSNSHNSKLSRSKRNTRRNCRQH